jgi:hypothetical protein
MSAVDGVASCAASRCAQALVNLAAMGNADTARFCGSAIAEIAMRPSCFERVVADNGIPSIVSLAYDTSVQGREKCALALCNLSTYRPARVQLLRVDAIDALASISGTGTELARRVCRWGLRLCNRRAALALPRCCARVALCACCARWTVMSTRLRRCLWRAAWRCATS